MNLAMKISNDQNQHRPLRLLFAAMLFIAVLPINGVRAEEQIRIQKSQGGKALKYLLYLPEGFDDSNTTNYPLVLFLHGGGEGGDDIQKVKKNGPPKLIQGGTQFPFILVAPQNPSETQFWDDQQLIQLLNEVQAELPVDERRIYLTGLSRGAFGAWRLAIQNPNRFAALVPICGGAPLPYIKRIKHVPTWVFHGAKDPVIPISESQRLVDALKSAGSEVKFTIYPEAKHDAWTETYSNPKVIQWMLQQRRLK